MSKSNEDKYTTEEALRQLLTPQAILPIEICTNLHPKVEAVQIPIGLIKLEQKKLLNAYEPLGYYNTKPAAVPLPAYPLTICCSPKCLRFDLIDKPVLAKVAIINCSARPIYMQCCGLWGERSQLGASWRSYPRTRFWIPPGLHVDLFVRAVPRESTPIAHATSALQIDACHLRDNVTGYFMIPIKSYFLKYQPASGE